MQHSHIVDVPCKDGVVLLVELPSEHVAAVDDNREVVLDHVAHFLAGPEGVLVLQGNVSPGKVLHQAMAQPAGQNCGCQAQSVDRIMVMPSMLMRPAPFLLRQSCSLESLACMLQSTQQMIDHHIRQPAI